MTFRLATLAAGVLVSAACGSTGTESGNCPGGTSAFAIAPGTITLSTTSVIALTETCGFGLMPDDLKVDRTFTYAPGTGTLTLQSVGADVASGVAACNGAALASSGVFSSGPCNYSRTVAVTWTASSETRWRIVYSESRSNFMSVAGMNCTPPAAGSCAIAYTAELEKR